MASFGTTSRRVGTVIGALALLVLVWGVLVEPRLLLDVEEHEARLPGLPAAWEGETVALLADFQVGMWFANLGMVEEAIEETVERRPALALIAGDFVYQPDSAVIDEAVELVRPLVDAGIPTYAVLGNHDYSLMKRDAEARPALARHLVRRLEQIGVRVLENEAERLDGPAGAAPLWLAGLGSEWAGRSLPERALAGVPDQEPRLVVMHNPVAYRDLPARSAPLALAAHTHGGQIRIPLLPSQSWLDIAREREVIADGWSRDDVGQEGNRLYVSRGIGFSLIPVRLFCRPELTVFRLTADAVG